MRSSPRSPLFPTLTLLALVAASPGAFAAGANDDIEGATPLPVPGVLTDSNIGATVEPGEPECFGSSGATVWYKFTSTFGAGTVNLEAETQFFHMRVGVYALQGEGLTQIACETGSPVTPARVSWQVLPATTYYVQIGAWQSGQGSFVISTAWEGTVLQPDSDDDRIADALEGEICGRMLVRDSINAQRPTLGSCETPNDYAPPATAVTFEVPTGPILTDLDSDGVPGTVGVQWTEVTVDPLAAEPVTFGATRDDATTVDPDDADPNQPVPYDELGGLVADLIEDALDAVDLDRDNVPDAAEPTLCAVENQNSPTDGTCVGSDYAPPF